MRLVPPNEAERVAPCNTQFDWQEAKTFRTDYTPLIDGCGGFPLFHNVAAVVADSGFIARVVPSLETRRYRCFCKARRRAQRGNMSAINTNVPPSDSGSFRRDTKAVLVGTVALSVVLWFSSRTLLSTNFLPHWY
jgi:hypothetical protein